jgi:hypothetical protein
VRERRGSSGIFNRSRFRCCARLGLNVVEIFDGRGDCIGHWLVYARYVIVFGGGKQTMFLEAGLRLRRCLAAGRSAARAVDLLQESEQRTLKLECSA